MLKIIIHTWYKRQIILLLSVLMSCAAFAYDFEIDGLYYNILSDNQVEVTYKELHANYFRGSLNIPEVVSYNEVIYHVISIGDYAFSDCYGLRGLTIPNGVTSIGKYAFSECQWLTGNLTIPNTVTKIGEGAFWGCGFDGNLTISNSLESIERNTFMDCSFTGPLTIPNSVTSIGNYAFYGCSGLSSISIPNSVTSIGNYAFYGCGLTSITIPNSVFSIEEMAFASCHNLVHVYSYITNPFFVESVFYSISSNASLHIPIGTKSLYQQYQGWTQYFTNIIEDINNPNPPATSYTLSIKATGNGSALYGRETIRNTKKSYTVDEGTSVTITFSPDDGYRIKSLKVNNVDATVNDSYTTKVNTDTKVEVEFEEIPVTIYSLSIKAVGNGSATYKNTAIRDNSQTFTVNEGSDVTIAFTPGDGYRIKMVKHDGADVTSNMIDNSYTICDIHADATVEVEFEERVNSFTEDGISYQVTSWEGHTLTVVAAADGLTIEIPDKISNQGKEWTVTGIDGNVLDDHETLAAIIWNPEASFTARVSNPNLLLYVKDEQYAPATIKNVVVNGYANSITLTDAQSGNNFYCPETFTAQSISYTHNYLMKTGLHESRGWETIALPFDVQKVSHSSKGEIVPYARWTSGSSVKPFWLYELSGSGFIEAESIKANTPYIISMPNNEAYPNEYHLTGRISFSSENVTVEKSDELKTTTFNDRSFAPNFICRDANVGYYALNVSNDYEYYQGSENEGSRFILNLRQIHPFEAYMTSSANTRSIGIFDGMTTAIRGIEVLAKKESLKVYDLSGKLLRVGISLEDMKQGLPAGVYIVNHQKIMIK